MREGTQRKSDDDDYNQALFFMLGEKNVWINDLSEKHTERTDSTQISTCCWANSLIIIAIIELNMHTFTKTDKCSYPCRNFSSPKLISFFYISPSYEMLLKTTQWCLFHLTEATWTFFLSPTFVLPQIFLCHLLQQQQIS